MQFITKMRREIKIFCWIPQTEFFFLEVHYGLLNQIWEFPLIYTSIIFLFSFHFCLVLILFVIKQTHKQTTTKSILESCKFPYEIFIHISFGLFTLLHACTALPSFPYHTTFTLFTPSIVSYWLAIFYLIFCPEGKNSDTNPHI